MSVQNETVLDGLSRRECLRPKAIQAFCVIFFLCLFVYGAHSPALAQGRKAYGQVQISLTVPESIAVTVPDSVEDSLGANERSLSGICVDETKVFGVQTHGVLVEKNGEASACAVLLENGALEPSEGSVFHETQGTCARGSTEYRAVFDCPSGMDLSREERFALVILEPSLE